MKITTPPQPFRKQLAGSVRRGFYRLRILGERGNWALAVQRGKSLHRIRLGFPTQAAALVYGQEKLGRRATVCRAA